MSTLLLAQEQVIAEHRNTLMINMTKNRIPKVMQRYVTQGGLVPQSGVLQMESKSENWSQKNISRIIVLAKTIYAFNVLTQYEKEVNANCGAFSLNIVHHIQLFIETDEAISCCTYVHEINLRV